MEKYIPIITRTDCCKVPVSDILYIRQHGRVTNIVTEAETFRNMQRREITWNIWTDVFFAVCVRSSSILNRYRPCGIRRSTLRTARALRSAGPIIFRPSRHSPHISKNCPCDVEFSCFFLQIIVKYLVVCAILPCRKISHIANRSRLPRFPAIRVPQGHAV